MSTCTLPIGIPTLVTPVSIDKRKIPNSVQNMRGFCIKLTVVFKKDPITDEMTADTQA